MGLGNLFGDEIIVQPSQLHIELQKIRKWDYYDNYQHGHYVDENDPDYGPIELFNATVESGGKVLFQGDVSKARLEYLKTASEAYNIIFDIISESGNYGILIIFEEAYRYKIENGIMILL